MGGAMSDEDARLRRVKAVINKGRYEVDVELLKRYIEYSSEIARLSLLALAALGTGVSLLVKDGKIPRELMENTCAPFLLGLGVAFLCAATGFALAHRYLATGGFEDHVWALRSLGATETEGLEKVNAKLASRQKLYLYSWRCLTVSVIGLGAGVLCLSIGSIMLLQTLPTR
jgi:hypothetical protein